MNSKMLRKLAIVSLLCIGLLLAPVCTAGFHSITKAVKHSDKIAEIQDKIQSYPTTQSSEYWALLFAVGVYYNHPDQDRPSMLEAVDDLYSTLLDSDHWQADHIRLIKAQDGTGVNLLQGLQWLDNMEDSEDVSLIYITTHGFPLRDQNGRGIDFPPFDEADGADEALVMYHGFENWYSYIWDDLLNFFISKLESQGVCLIVDSCYSGGFRDPPFENANDAFEEYTAQSFSEGLVEDLAGQGRVVLMSSEEYTVSYGSYFSSFLIEGFKGWADLAGNIDGVVSAEEAFYYSQFWVDLLGDQHPTIADYYPGDLPITTAWSE